MSETMQSILNEDLENLENKISIIALSDPEKYEGFNSRLKILQDSLIGLSGLEFEQRKKDIVAEITSIQVDFDSYMDGSDALPEDSLKQGLELTSGRAKLRGHRVGLYKSIIEDLKKLDHIDIEDLRKLNSKWKVDKNSDEYQFSPFEISALSEQLSDVFLDYQIKELQRTGKMPKESIQGFTTFEEYQKSIRDRLIQVSRTSNLSFSDKLELDNLLKEQNLERLVSTPDLWKILASKTVDISNDDISKLLGKEAEKSKDTVALKRESDDVIALVPVEPKKQGFFANLFNKKEVPYMIITIGEKNGEKIQKKIKLKDGVARLPSKYRTVRDWEGDDISPVTEVFISEGVKKIQAKGFADCELLTSIYLPSTLESIENSAFESCTRLTKVKIPDSVKEIGKATFKKCNGLLNVRLPNSIKRIENDTFNDCSNLNSIELPDSVEEIGSNAFNYCKSLKSVKMSENIKNIGEYAFRRCEILKDLYLPGGLRSIKKEAFVSCWNLESIELPESLEHLGDNAFMDCNRMRAVKIKGLIPDLRFHTFYGCEALERVEVTENFRKIPPDMFEECQKLKTKNIIRVAKGYSNTVATDLKNREEKNAGRSTPIIGSFRNNNYLDEI